MAAPAAAADGRAGRGEAVQEGLFAFVIRALEEGALRRRKDGLQKAPELPNTFPRHLEQQMMFIFVPILLHSFRQMLREKAVIVCMILSLKSRGRTRKRPAKASRRPLRANNSGIQSLPR